MTRALGRVAALVHRESGIRLGGHQHAFLQAALDRIGRRRRARRRSCAARPTRSSGAAAAHAADRGGHRQGDVVPARSRAARAHRLAAAARAARARGADHVRVWTAACATGEEAYSLALLACEAFAPAPPPVSILATDISPGRARPRARRRATGRARCATLEPALRARYFARPAGGLIVGRAAARARRVRAAQPRPRPVPAARARRRST